MTKTLTNQSFDAIALHCVFDVFFGNGKTQSWIALIIGSSQYTEIAITQPLRLLKDLFELARFQKSLRPGKALGLFHNQPIKRRDACDPLHGVQRVPCDHHGSSCEHENRVCACA